MFFLSWFYFLDASSVVYRPEQWDRTFRLQCKSTASAADQQVAKGLCHAWGIHVVVHQIRALKSLGPEKDDSFVDRETWKKTMPSHGKIMFPIVSCLVVSMPIWLHSAVAKSPIFRAERAPFRLVKPMFHAQPRRFSEGPVYWAQDHKWQIQHQCALLMGKLLQNGWFSSWPCLIPRGYCFIFKVDISGMGGNHRVQ